MEEARCFSVSSIGDSSSPCLVAHNRTSSYVGWLAENQVTFHWATQRNYMLHYLDAYRHSFQRANAFTVPLPGPSQLVSEIAVLRNFCDAALLFLTDSTTSAFAVTSLTGTLHCSGTGLTAWGHCPDLLWLHITQPAAVLVLHFISSQQSIHIDWADLPPPSEAMMVFRPDPGTVILLFGGAIAASETRSEGASGNMRAILSNHPGDYTAIFAHWPGDGDMSDVSLAAPRRVDFSTRAVHVLSDELPYKFCPFDTILTIEDLAPGPCSIRIVDAGGCMPLGFLADEAGLRLNAVEDVPEHLRIMLDVLGQRAFGNSELEDTWSTSTPQVYRLMRSLSKVELTEEEVALEMTLLDLISDAEPDIGLIGPQWLAKLPVASSSSRCISKFFSNLKTVWTSREASDELNVAIDALLQLAWRKIPPVGNAFDFSYQVYDQLYERKAVYAYLHGRYDILFGDGHWCLEPHQKAAIPDGPPVFTGGQRRRSSVSSCDLWNDLIHDSANQNWNLIIRNLNDLIARKIYKRFEIGYGQNILKSQSLQVPWNRLTDVGGFGFPWGRHGPLNRIDLWMDFLSAILNASTNLSPDRMISLFRLRSYPEVASLTKLFTFSINQPSAGYHNLVVRALREETAPSPSVPLQATLPPPNSMDDGAELEDAAAAPPPASPGDVMIGVIWNLLRECYYVSGMLLGYGMIGASELLSESYAITEAILDKLTMHSSKKIQSYLTSTTLTDNGLTILDHALDYSDEPDWFHDNLDLKKSPAVNQLLISLIFSTTFARQLSINSILEILFADHARRTEIVRRPRPRHTNARPSGAQALGCDSGGEFVLRIHQKMDLSLLDGPLYLASAFAYDRDDTKSIFLTYRLLQEFRYLLQTPHTNIDSTVSDSYDLKIDGSGLSWYKKLHNDSVHATTRQGIFLGAAMGIHLGSLQHELVPFKTQMLKSILKLYTMETTPPDKNLQPSNSLAPAYDTNLRPLLEASLMLMLGIGYLNWCTDYGQITHSIYPVLFDEHFFMRDTETIFYRVVLWCLLHWRQLDLTHVAEIFPACLFERLTSGKYAEQSPLSVVIRKPRADMDSDESSDNFDESNATQSGPRQAHSMTIEALLRPACSVLDHLSEAHRLEVHVAILAAICYALALRHTSSDVTSITEFLLRCGMWLTAIVPQVSDNAVLLSHFAQESVGINDTSQVFALNWIIASLGLSCAGAADEIVASTIDQWAATNPRFQILFRANSAKSMITGQPKLREKVEVRLDDTMPEAQNHPLVDAQQLGLDIIGSFPMGQHWGDNRQTLQMFDLFSELWISSMPKTPVLYIDGCHDNVLEFSQHMHDEQDIYVTDADENVMNLASINEGPQVAVHYPEKSDPVELRNAKSKILYLQRGTVIS